MSKSIIHSYWLPLTKHQLRTVNAHGRKYSGVGIFHVAIEPRGNWKLKNGERINPIYGGRVRMVLIAPALGLKLSKVIARQLKKEARLDE